MENTKMLEDFFNANFTLLIPNLQHSDRINTYESYEVKGFINKNIIELNTLNNNLELKMSILLAPAVAPVIGSKIVWQSETYNIKSIQECRNCFGEIVGYKCIII